MKKGDLTYYSDSIDYIAIVIARNMVEDNISLDNILDEILKDIFNASDFAFEVVKDETNEKILDRLDDCKKEIIKRFK